MATLSSDGKYVTVEKGDNLWRIAVNFMGDGQKYKQLAALNNISNPELIYVGQQIYLTKEDNPNTPKTTPTPSQPNPKPAEPGQSTPKTSQLSKTAIVTAFGLQADVDRTLYATWVWYEPTPNTTRGYEVQWDYNTKENVWFHGDDSETTNTYSTFSIPTNATEVRFRVKPLSTTFEIAESDNSTREIEYWQTVWTSYSNFNVNVIPPEAPSAPSVTVNGYILTASLNDIDDEITRICFQIIQNDVYYGEKHIAYVRTGVATCIFTLSPGNTYKVRAAAYKANIESKWSSYSSSVGTPPAASSGFTSIAALNSTEVKLMWAPATAATGYTVEYTNKSIYFDSGSNTSTQDSTANSCIISGLETGQEWFFRVKAKNDTGESAWSSIKSIILGTKPAAPTTWSSTSTCIVGEQFTLFWVHNAEDGSDQTYAEVQIYENGIKKPVITIKGATNYYEITTSRYSEGTIIQWAVRTAGVTKEYGDWSVQRSVTIYAPPTLDLTITELPQNGVNIDKITKFPFYINAVPGPATQTPTGYQVTIKSINAYATVDEIGNPKAVNIDEVIYSKYFNLSQSLVIEMSAGNIDLENGMQYKVICTVSMSSGLTAEATKTITVNWKENQYTPNAEIGINYDNYTATIRPYCIEHNYTYLMVTKNGNNYIKGTKEIDYVYGEKVKDTFTTTNEQVYEGMTADGVECYYCITDKETLIEGVTLGVYRREFDGSFTEIAKGLKNSPSTYITDPHPSLDYARYRIVSVTNDTGAVGYYDLPGYPVNAPGIIIQWNEQWTEFDTYGNSDPLTVPSWSGSMLKLPYNIDVSDSHSPDVTLAEYIGREHPVSYYGTQKGETSSWNVEIPATDKDTLYALRRLAVWMGDCYVREPSGTGYWANVTVSISQTHQNLTIPVSFSVTRVEGGT